MAIDLQSFDPRAGVPRLFFALPARIYRRDPRYVAPFPDAVLASLRRPEFDGRQLGLVALESGQPIARLVARRSPTLRDPRGRPYGTLGFFEALDRRRPVGALFDAAIDWLRERGVGPIVGPMDGDTWHSYRLNVGPFAERPFLMEPYNPPYYAELWQRRGFEVLEHYCSKRVDDLAAAAAAMAPGLARAEAAGYRFESLEIDRFEDELDRLYELSCAIFAGNFLYTEISRDRFLELHRGNRALLDPELVSFARAPDGRDAGFLFGFPDRFRAVAAMRGRRGLWGRLHHLAAGRRVDTVNLKSLGVTPGDRRSGLAAALMHRAYRTAQRQGYTRANLCLILDGNPSARLDGETGTVLRRYHLYQLGRDR